LLPQDTDPARGSEEGGVLAAVLQDLRLAGCGRKHRATEAVAGVGSDGACSNPVRLLLWPRRR